MIYGVLDSALSYTITRRRKRAADDVNTINAPFTHRDRLNCLIFLPLYFFNKIISIHLHVLELALLFYVYSLRVNVGRWVKEAESRVNLITFSDAKRQDRNLSP